MPTSARRWTADEVRALPDDGNRYEVVDGELLVTPAPSWPHQRAVLELTLALHPFVREHALGQLLLSPADVALGQSMVQPDLFVTTTPAAAPAPNWSELGPLLLVVEVLSSGTARQDRFTKRVLYQRQGVPEYWIVDLDSRAVERWRPTDERPEILGERLEWCPEHASDTLVIDLVAMFREVLGS